MYPGQMPMYYQMPPYDMGMPQDARAVVKPQEQVHVQSPKFPMFPNQPSPVLTGTPIGSNLDLVMKVPLNVSVEIGKTKRKSADYGIQEGTVSS